MDEMPSSVFRAHFAKLDQPTLVTVNGHPIGVWSPAVHPFPGLEPPLTYVDRSTEPPHYEELPNRRLSQADRDAILRRIQGKPASGGTAPDRDG